MRVRNVALFTAAVGLCAVIAWALVALVGGPDSRGRGGATPGMVTSQADLGGPFTLTGQDGKRVSDMDFRGRYMLIYFGYSFCPDVCPTELQKMGRALDQVDAAVAEKVVPVFVTVDPARDTPEQLGPYVKAFHPRMVALTGSAEDIDAVAKAYKVYYGKPAGTDPNDANYLMDHTSFVYLMGPEGKLRGLFRPDATAAQIAAGLARAVR